ncbi:MAG: pitrilysin family protein, partial [Actinomycetota bacterium]|nr:pitrilysin family protein [Actinomycetota bacterium]
MRRRGGVLGAVAMLAMAACTPQPGVQAVQSDALDPFVGETLEVDPETRLITLDNGLVVYLRENNRPGGAADMRLAINAGSALEEPDQAGGAHFLEHMLFNGTEQFPGNDLIDVLRDFGMEFGADLNAYTSYDETVYELSVPLSDPDNLGTGLDVLQQWLSAATIDDADVVEERGVVLDEWRVREETLQGRQSAVLDTMFLAGSVYDGHHPIGGEQQIEEMTAGPLRRFYDTWYRPDNAAVVVVGDIDLDEVEEMIHARFDDLAPRGDTPERAALAIDRFTETVVAVAADPDAVEAVAELTYPAPAVPLNSTGPMLDDLLVLLGFDMIANRLSDDVARGADSVREASTSNNDSVRAIRAPSVWINADASKAAAAIDALLVEFERARRYGFDDNELARAVDVYRTSVQSDYEARDTVQDRDHADSMVGHFLVGSPIPDAETQYETFSALLDSVTATAVAEAFDRFTAASAPHLFVGIPDDVDGVPSEAELTGQIEQLGEREIEPREATQAVGDELMAAPQPVAEESSEPFVSEPSYFLDATRLEFPNGAVVILNPTDISDGYIAIDARSPGGLSVVPDEEVFAARYAPQAAALSGVGELDQV